MPAPNNYHFCLSDVNEMDVGLHGWDPLAVYQGDPVTRGFLYFMSNYLFDQRLRPPMNGEAFALFNVSLFRVYCTPPPFFFANGSVALLQLKKRGNCAR